MDIYFIADMVGMVGVSMVISSFFLLQSGRIEAKSYLYQMLNIVGATFLLFSLYYHWNLASVVIELLWLVISIYGLIRLHKKAKKSEPETYGQDVIK